MRSFQGIDAAMEGLLYALLLILAISAIGIVIGMVCFIVFLVTSIVSWFGINIWEALERAFDEQKQHRLATAANSISKMFSSDEEKTKQLAFLEKKKALLHEGIVLAQRDVYHAEEIECSSKSKSVPAQQARLRKHQQGSKEASDELFKSWRKYKNLLEECPKGAWIREDERNQSKKLASREEQMTCKYRQGCCAFGCGCCEKVRAFTEVQRQRPEMYFHSHCTSECSCCLRRDLRTFGCEPEGDEILL
ncbi:hypothetical protein N7490_002318 [Penicillium lividum]|nr:hypothetical protein N7490_002318 [Penicillium lividum]